MNWQPIESAPKDGTRVILSWGGKSINGFFLDNSHTSTPWAGWRVESMVVRPTGTPTRWQPFPAPYDVPACRAEQRGPAEWVCDCKQMRPDCKPNAGVPGTFAGTEGSVSAATHEKLSQAVDKLGEVGEGRLAVAVREAMDALGVGACRSADGNPDNCEEFGCQKSGLCRFPADVEAARGGCECAACKVVPHASDCAVHNEPAMPAGPCDCGAWLRRARELVLALLDADRASERSVAKGGPELDEPFAVAFDALDYHLKACAAGVSGKDDETKGAEGQ